MRQHNSPVREKDRCAVCGTHTTAAQKQQKYSHDLLLHSSTGSPFMWTQTTAREQDTLTADARTVAQPKRAVRTTLTIVQRSSAHDPATDRPGCEQKNRVRFILGDPSSYRCRQDMKIWMCAV